MTPDQLRQGAALVRCLVEGDETARGPLSDFVEEFGLPGKDEQCKYSVAEMLRKFSDWRSDPNSIQRDVRIIRLVGQTIYSLQLGTWPLWAWEGREPTSEAS